MSRGRQGTEQPPNGVPLRAQRHTSPCYICDIDHMRGATTVAVALWLIVASAASIAGIVWKWSDGDSAASDGRSMLVLAVLAAIAGSVVHLIPTFTLRAGRWTLEHGFGWWYLLRPFAAALLGMLFSLVVRAGLLTIGTDEAGPRPEVLVVAGGLAGLFTDRVMQRMLTLLGSVDPSKSASQANVPHLQSAEIASTDHHGTGPEQDGGGTDEESQFSDAA